MKVVILNKSDATGGAAVVSRRLMEALREENVDARMLVCEKLTDSPFIELASSKSLIKFSFLAERLKIFISNGFNRESLFKIDTGEFGLPLYDHPLVKEADAILINWVNQGMLSLKGLKKILKLGKPVIFTMHDMWWLTGICHHAGNCRHYLKNCGNCPLLGKKSSSKDLSFKIWKDKNGIYSDASLMKKTAFVAVSSWLKNKATESSLLTHQRLEVIHNAFPITSYASEKSFLLPSQSAKSSKIRILFGAARLDDPIKGLPILRKTSNIIKNSYPEIAANIELCLFGGIKDITKIENFRVPVNYMGVLKGEDKVREAYMNSNILVSSSSYETLPGTLVEAQAYGCIPVSFNQGGQADIVRHLSTGYIAEYDESSEIAAQNLAKGIEWAWSVIQNPEELESMQRKMRKSVEEQFSYSHIADKYLSLIRNLNGID